MEESCMNCDNGNGVGGCAYPICCIQFSEWKPIPAKMEWQPIETVPMNEKVLFYATSLGIAEGVLLPNRIIHAFASGFGFRDKYKGVTHWMPLPKPPAGSP